MFKLGDYIVYGTNGVCTVDEIGTIDFQENKKFRLYYTLTPVYAKGSKLFTPVDNDKVIMRPIISKEEAEALVNNITNIETSWYTEERKCVEGYKSALKSCDCRELIKIIKILYLSKQSKLAEGKKVTASDEKYFLLAKDSLYGELAIVLGIQKEKVEGYITERIR